MDPRDRISGLLGLATDSKILVPQPDYAASVATVYTELVVKTIRQYKSLDIICYGRPHRKQPNLSSWIPDWSGQCYGVLFIVSTGLKL